MLVLLCWLTFAETQFEKEVGKQLQVEPRYAKEVVAAVFAAIENELTAGREVNVRGIGKFYVSERASHYRTHPITKKRYEVPRRKYPRFRSSESFKKRFREK